MQIFHLICFDVSLQLLNNIFFLRMKLLGIVLKAIKSGEQCMKQPYCGSKIFMENQLQWEEVA